MHTSTPRRDTIAPLLARIPLLATLHDYARVTLMDDGGVARSRFKIYTHVQRAGRRRASVNEHGNAFASLLGQTHARTMGPRGDEVGHKVEPSGTRNDAIDEHKRDARDTAAASPTAPAPAPAQCRLMHQAAARLRQLSVTASCRDCTVERANVPNVCVLKKMQLFPACRNDSCDLLAIASYILLNDFSRKYRTCV